MDVITTRLDHHEKWLKTHDLVLWGNPETGINGIAGKMNDMLVRTDERANVEKERAQLELARHNELRSILNFRLTIIGLLVSAALLIMAYLTYRVETNHVSLLLPANAQNSLVPVEAKYTLGAAPNFDWSNR